MSLQIIDHKFIEEIHILGGSINLFIKEGLSILDLDLDNFHLKYNLTYHYLYHTKDNDINIMIFKGL